MGIFSSKNGLKKDKMKASTEYDNKIYTEVAQVMMNDGVNICANACSSCWDVKLPKDYTGRSEYVSRRTATGHGSVTEHSNHVFYLEFIRNINNMEDIVEVLENCRYLHIKVKSRNDFIYMLIGGSWRGFNYLIRNCNPTNNKAMRRIMNAIYDNCDWSGFADLIKEGIIPDNFVRKEQSLIPFYLNAVDPNKDDPIVINENLNCYGLDNIQFLIDNIINICPHPNIFTIKDLFEFCTVTIEFKNMSRTATHQLVRHRNAITQESQRYVDYSNSCFACPSDFKDIYDDTHEYSIQFGRSTQKFTLKTLGDAICKIYGQLSDKEKLGKYALLKEDARAYLPGNVQCRKLFMTFTFDHFFKFLELREDKHAQAEIRKYAVAIGDWFARECPEYENQYRKSESSDWVNNPLPTKNVEEDSAFDKEGYIEAITNSIKTETIEKENEDE